MLALDDAFARTSAKCVESDADRPKAVKASVTISLVVARSSPEAAARFIIPSIPSSMSAVFHPAIAMYEKASADSEALNFVLAPISFALSVRLFNSCAVAPDIAATLDIDDSKFAPVLIAAVPIPTTAVAAPPMIAVVAFNAVEAQEPILLIPSWNPEESMEVSNFSVPS